MDLIQAEIDVRNFAKKFPTPSTLLALEHCESGRLSWVDVAALFTRSLQKTLKQLEGS